MTSSHEPTWQACHPGRPASAQAAPRHQRPGQPQACGRCGLRWTGDRKGGQPGRRAGSPTTEDVAAHFATRIATGKLPSQREIRRQWHVGSDTAKALREGLKAGMSTSAN